MPTIAVVRAGEDPASVSYARMIKRSFERAGMGFVLHTLPDTATQDQVLAMVNWLNVDESVHGIMVQEPLPRGIDDIAVKMALSPAKDADGVSPINAGRLAQAAPVGRSSGVQDYLVPATPLGGLELLLRSNVELSGRRAVVVGRSNIVGRPLSFLLMQHHASVTMCHSRSRPLEDVHARGGHPLRGGGRGPADQGRHGQAGGGRGRLWREFCRRRNVRRRRL